MSLPEIGYSGRPLAAKLGLKPGQRVAFIGLPGDLAGLAEAADFAQADVLAANEAIPAGRDVIHAFFTQAQNLREALPRLKAAIRPEGAIWISWPKKAAKAATDLSENPIRDMALAAGLVDVKVCAVSDVWSGLKLVIPVAARPAAK